MKTAIASAKAVTRDRSVTRIGWSSLRTAHMGCRPEWMKRAATGGRRPADQMAMVSL